MKMKIEIKNQNFTIDSDGRIDLSIPFSFDGQEANAFGAPSSKAEAYSNEQFVGDTTQGGSCNVSLLKLVPHCNGTHTECVGHLTEEKIFVPQVLGGPWTIARLVSLQPEKASKTSETYGSKKEANDFIISAKALEKALLNSDSKTFQALIIRTLPNNSSKRAKHYESAPYFSTEAMKYIRHLEIQHLMVDLPSIDKMSDGGELSNHRQFWQMEPGQKKSDSKTARHKLITELIYVPNEVYDGLYLLNLQTSNFLSDAVPSRPVIYPLEKA